MKQKLTNTSSIRLKKTHKNSLKSNENKLNLEINLADSEKLKLKPHKEKNKKNYRNGSNEVSSEHLNVFETINSNYKNKNISISPNRNSNSRSNSYKKKSADLKQGAFSFKQSIIRPKSLPKKTVLKSRDFRTEVVCRTPLSIFGYVPQFNSSLATQQDIDLENKQKKMNFKIFAWQKLMREMDCVEED